MTDKIILKTILTLLSEDPDGNYIVEYYSLEDEEICELIKLLKDPNDIQHLAEEILSTMYNRSNSRFESILKYIIQNYNIDKDKLNNIGNNHKYAKSSCDLDIKWHSDRVKDIKEYCGF